MTTRRPVLIETEGPAPSPAEAPMVPDPAPAAASVAAGPPAWAAAVGAPRSRLASFAGWAIGGFAGFVVSVAAWDFVTGLLARNTALGALAMLLAGAAVLALVLLAAQELAGFARAARIDRLRTALAAARAGDVAEARRRAAEVEALYSTRPEMRWHLARLHEGRAEVMDADAWIDLTEAALMAPLDAAARREIGGGAPGRGGGGTGAAGAGGCGCRALGQPADGAAVVGDLWRAVRGAGRLATDAARGVASGGDRGAGTDRRPDGIRRGRGCAGQAVAAVRRRREVQSAARPRGHPGAVPPPPHAVPEAARVGIAAMDLCRPMPFRSLPAPRVANLVPRALAGLFGRAGTT